jgi:hypothetical protein
MVRENLEMEVAFVSEFAGDRLVFRALEGDAGSFGWREGEGFPLDESYCEQVLDGRLPNVVADARSEDLTKDLWLTREANIGSYVAVPVVLSDGRPYGTLRKSQSRSAAKGARPGAHGGGSPRVEQADKARRAPIVRWLCSPGRFHRLSSWRNRPRATIWWDGEANDAARPRLAMAAFSCRGR